MLNIHRNHGHLLWILFVLSGVLFISGCGGGGSGSGDDGSGLPATNATAAELQERQVVFAAVNAQRKGAGLTELVIRDDLNAIAQAHAEDMSRRGFFDHVSPEGKDVHDRLDHAAVSYLIGGENIARNQSSTLAVQAWLDSPPHREGIFLPDYRQTGIGVSRIDPSQPPWTGFHLTGEWWHFVQVFTD